MAEDLKKNISSFFAKRKRKVTKQPPLSHEDINIIRASFDKPAILADSAKRNLPEQTKKKNR